MFEDVAELTLDLPAEAEAALKAAGAAWADEARAENHVLEALELAPHALAARIGAYKFYFYRNRLDAALPHALGCLELAARRLNRATDWRLVDPVPCGAEPWPRLWLQSLVAYGYLLARLGRLIEAREVLSKAALMDSGNAFSAARILGLVERGGAGDDDE